MQSNEYVELALKTESSDFSAIGERFNEIGTQRLLHAGMGLTTEAGEFVDALKKHLFYGKPLDRVNLAEELGDLFWYCAIVADELDVSFSEVMEKNIAKLKARYGEKFSEHKAENRDLIRERNILEGQ